MKKLHTYFALFFLLAFLPAKGQNAINYWYFGIKAGAYFDNTGIHATTGSIKIAAEGTASISDGCGVLFYTDGDTVWNKDHQQMVNGVDIGGRCTAFGQSSSTQAALIVRQPASDSVFYIFTTDCIEDQLADGLRYSVVNINKNNGLGEVILKNQLLFSNAEEKVTAAKHSNGCDVWIISHQYGTTNFYSYLLSSTGLNTTPVISSSGQIHSSPTPSYYNARGYLKASPNGQKLINVNVEGAYSWADTALPELFNFNTLNGSVVSDFVFPRDTSYWWPSYNSWTIPFYGASFSPDNSKLYLSSGFYGPNFYQYDLNAGSPAGIVASKTFLSGSYPFPADPLIPTSLVNAPDGKMYVSQRWKKYLGVVNSPNSAGLACNYVDSAFNLANGTTSDWGGLPNFFEDYINPRSLAVNFSFVQPTDNDTLFFTNNSVGASSYTWDFGDGTSSNSINPFHVYPDEGYYNVSLIARDSLCDIDRFCMTVYASVYTGIDENGNTPGFTVFPNPFSDLVTISITGNEAQELEIYNVLGEKLKSMNISGQQKIVVQMGEEFSPGIYFVRLKNNKNMHTKRLVKL